MTSYWFSVRFGAAESTIGLIMAISYVAAGSVALASVALARRIGPVRSVVYLQLCGTLFIIALPFAPFIWLAAICNIACTALNLGSRGSRQAVLTNRRRGQRTWFSKVRTIVVMGFATGMWPAAFGEMLEGGEFVLPFCIAASAQLLSVMWYKHTYSAVLKGDPETTSGSA